jgi:hypothetical protein
MDHHKGNEFLSRDMVEEHSPSRFFPTRMIQSNGYISRQNTTSKNVVQALQLQAPKTPAHEKYAHRISE